MENRNAKSLLAKLMAAEDINVEYSEKASTASFDTESRTLRMPVFKDISSDATDLFLGHEVGHALYTPQGEILKVLEKGGVYKNFVNVVEDARIEKMIQNKFPGLKRCFYDGYTDLMERDFFGTNGKDVNDYNFIDRLNLHFKAGIRAGVEFSDEEKPYVDRMANLRNWEETISLSDDLYEYCKAKGEDEEPESYDDSDSAESGDGEPDDGEMDWNGDTDSDDNNEETSDDGKSAGGSGESEEEGEEEGSGNADDDSADEESEESEESTESDTSGDNDKDANSDKSGGSSATASMSGGDETNDQLVTETQNKFNSKLEDLVDTDTTYHYSRIPKVDIEKVLVPMAEVHRTIDETIANDTTSGDLMTHAHKDFKKFSSEQKSLISYLIKEFEMRKSADEHKRTKEGKTGILNPNKLHAYKFSEDIFLRNSVVSDGKNHGFVMFVDWSGSMGNNMHDTIDQLMLLAMFCKKAQIPFDVFAFTNSWSRNSDDPKYTGSYYEFEDKTQHDIALSIEFSLLHLISSTLKAAAFNKSMAYMSYIRGAFACRYNRWAGENVYYPLPSQLGLGGTPLNEAIISAFEIIPMFQKKNNVQIVNTVFLTDGQGHPNRNTWNEGSWTSRANHMNTTVVIDPITKKHYNKFLDDQVLLEILKDRTGVTLAGFFITPSTKRSFINEMYHTNIGWSKAEELWLEIKADGYGVVENDLGYDEFYMISSKSLEINAEGLEIDADMTKGRMKNAFVKAQKGKIANKQMLARFAELVS